MLSSALTVPTEHGELLLQPQSERMLADSAANLEFNYHSKKRIADISIAELRQRSRPDVLALARTFTESIGVHFESKEADSPMVMTGHQSDFYHPGVWLKLAVTGRLASRLGGTALNLVQDCDPPTATALTVPTVHDNLVVNHEVPFASADPLVAAAEAPPPSASQTKQFIGRTRRFLDSSLGVESFDEFAKQLQHHRPQSKSVPDLLTRARRKLDSDFSLTQLELPVSWLQQTDGFRSFFRDIYDHAGSFARIYNEALGGYRLDAKIRNPAHPMPDLQQSGQDIELPFWGWVKHGPRQPLYRIGGQLMLGRDPIGDAWPPDRPGITIAPRALTLTLFSRLLLADYFVHGTGGARYDRITDEILRTYYKLQPPAYACASATLHLPLPHSSSNPRQLAELIYRRRDLDFNPQRYRNMPAPLLRQRRDLVSENNTLKRKANGSSRRRRHEIFNHIRTINSKMATPLRPQATEVDQQIKQCQALIASDRLARSRDYFYAFHQRSQLKILLDNLGAAGL